MTHPLHDDHTAWHRFADVEPIDETPEPAVLTHRGTIGLGLAILAFAIGIVAALLTQHHRLWEHVR